MKKTNNKGFSLVELIVVIAIMAVLIGVLAPTFTKYVERGRKSTDVQNVAAVITAIQTYAADPMATDALSSGKVVFTTSEEAVSSTNATGNADKALAAAGINNIKLSSAKWGATTIEITVTVNTDGSVTFACPTTLATGHDILKGKYE